MKSLSALFVLCAALLAPSTRAAESFEGRMSMTVTSSSGEKQAMNYATKGKLLRIDVPAGRDGMTAGIIMDLAKREMIMLLSQQQKYMVMALPEQVEQTARERASGATLEMTGTTEIILGYPCEQCTIKEERGTTEVWLAQGLGSFMSMSNGAMSGGRNARTAAWEQALKGKDAFPLRVITRDADGKTTFQMDVTKIEKTALPDSLFVPPANYRPFEMPAGLPGLGGAASQN